MQSAAMREKQRARYAAKQSGDIPTINHDFKDEVSDKTKMRIDIEERRLLKKELSEVWDYE